MLNEKQIQSVDCLIALMSDDAKDYIYRKQWAKHVEEDVEALLEDDIYDDMSEDTKQELISNVAYAYAFEGRYDCNLSYWNNLKNLINEC